MNSHEIYVPLVLFQVGKHGIQEGRELAEEEVSNAEPGMRAGAQG